jgi:hypothetical protein
MARNMSGNRFAIRYPITLGPEPLHRDELIASDTQLERVGQTEKLVVTAPFLVLSALGLAACGGGGESSTPGPSAPSAPSGLTATPGNAQVSLTWTASAGATSYNTLRATVTGGPYAMVGTSASSPFVDKTAANGTTYSYVVTAQSSAGTSANSAAVSATPAGTVASLSRAQAARFLAQAAFGGSDTEIQNLQNQANGIQGWLTQQFAMPVNPSGHLSNVAWMQANNLISIEFDTTGVQSSFWRKLIGSADLLRQRMMLALTDLFVVNASATQLT